MTTRRVVELLNNPKPSGAFDTAHLQTIHRYIFQDVYAWAGQFRTVDISKSGGLFGLIQYIVPGLNKTLDDLRKERHLGGAGLKRFANRGAYYLGEINAIHPFRDGNGRTQREFMRQLALRNLHALDWSGISREEMTQASRQSFRISNAGLEAILCSALNNQRNKAREQSEAARHRRRSRASGHRER